jgi:Domain of unknown function (DUF4376)
MNNIPYAIYETQTGQVLFGGYALSETDIAPHASNTRSVHLGLATIGSMIIAGDVVELPPRTSPNHVFDYALRQWIDPRTLRDFKDEQWALVKAQRDSHETGGFTWDNSTFDSDPISQQRISGAVQLAMLASGAGQAFSIEWTLQDNSVRLLGATDMLAIGTTLGMHISNCHEIARGLRGQIEAASTVEEVTGIGWPIAPL